MNGLQSTEFAVKFWVIVISVATRSQKPIKIQSKISNKKENASERRHRKCYTSCLVDDQLTFHCSKKFWELKRSREAFKWEEFGTQHVPTAV